MNEGVILELFTLVLESLCLPLWPIVSSFMLLHPHTHTRLLKPYNSIYTCIDQTYMLLAITSESNPLRFLWKSPVWMENGDLHTRTNKVNLLSQKNYALSCWPCDLKWLVQNKECIMRKKENGKECDMTTHLIDFQVFTHVSCVTKFSNTWSRRSKI